METGFVVTQEEQHGGNGFLVLMVLAILGTIAYFSLQHAVDRHGAVAGDIVNQCTNGSWLAEKINPITGRHAKVCQLGIKFGIAVFEENGDLVTAFRNKAQSLKEAIDYLVNVGYNPQCECIGPIF